MSQENLLVYVKGLHLLVDCALLFVLAVIATLSMIKFARVDTKLTKIERTMNTKLADCGSQ